MYIVTKCHVVTHLNGLFGAWQIIRIVTDKEWDTEWWPGIQGAKPCWWLESRQFFGLEEQKKRVASRSQPLFRGLCPWQFNRFPMGSGKQTILWPWRTKEQFDIWLVQTELAKHEEWKCCWSKWCARSQYLFSSLYQLDLGFARCK